MKNAIIFIGNFEMKIYHSLSYFVIRINVLIVFVHVVPSAFFLYLALYFGKILEISNHFNLLRHVTLIEIMEL